MPGKQHRDICEIISVIYEKVRGYGRRMEMLSLLAVAASVLMLSLARVFLMPSDEQHLTDLVGSLSPRLLHVSGRCSLLYMIPGL